jgi:hypothetical protein
MNPKAKSTMRGIGLFILGASLGGMVSMKFLSPFYSWTTWMWTGNGIGSYAEVQYYKANYNRALKAQTEYLSYLAGIEKKKSEWNTWSVPWMTEQIMEYERTVTYARIAMLEEREGKSAEANINWANAEKAANAVGWKNSSREHIQQIVKEKGTEFGKMQGSAEPQGGAGKPHTP